jgi:hypothetical protein
VRLILDGALSGQAPCARGSVAARSACVALSARRTGLSRPRHPLDEMSGTLPNGILLSGGRRRYAEPPRDGRRTGRNDVAA